MRTTASLEQALIKNVKDLSIESLKEALDFVLFLRQKEKKTTDNVNATLTLLDESQTAHLLGEFADYRKRYPHE